MKENYYITTAIAYASGKPHVGNIYEIVLADAIARFKRLKGYEVYFQTGTDEHGEKVAIKAAENNLEPQQYASNISREIKNMWDLLNISYDGFVYTTDEQHVKVVQKVFQKLFDQGDIYLGSYEGKYCIPCESFFTDSQLDNDKCPDCGREVTLKSEEAYFFKMSKYQDRLSQYIETHPDFILPISRKNEMVNNFLKPGLQDLCVSRTSFDWGVKVPMNPKHVVYVWLDALLNYITNIGYDTENSSEKFQKCWPADLHLIGKDILRFHTLYWPIFLLALDLPLPKQIFGHPWLLMDNDKMSKSKGNVIYPDDLVEIFGVDAIRYYLLHEIPFANDGNITYELVIERVNSDLANVLGNLVNRTISMVKKYFDGSVKSKKYSDEISIEFINVINALDDAITIKMDSLEIGLAIDVIFNLLRKSNKYIDDTTPWVLAKQTDSKDQLEEVLYNLLEAIRVSAVYLTAFLPDTAKEIFRQLHISDTSFQFNENNVYYVENPEPLFKRIDKEELLKKIGK